MPVPAEMGRLIDALERLVGKRISIVESISRARERGHDRHWSTWSRFELVVDRIGGTISGAQLRIEGDGATWSMAAIAIERVEFEPELVVVEQFEERTERRTTIRAL